MNCPNCGYELPESNRKFYSKSWFIILMLFMFFPIGLVLMWMYMKFNKPSRIVITLLCFFFLVIFVLGYTADDSVLIDELRSDIVTLNSEKDLLEEKNQELTNEIKVLKDSSNSENNNAAEVSSEETGDDTNSSGKDSQKNKSSDTPSKIELISYAQTTLKDFYPSPKFPADKDSYNCPGTGLRYKIEGQISTDGKSSYQNFYIIIEFVDDSYEEYELISAQVGNDTLY